MYHPCFTDIHAPADVKFQLEFVDKLITVDHSSKGEDVVEIMSKIQKDLRRQPERIKVDNGSEFVSKALDKWAYENDVTLDFSRPGKSTDNAYIESFNGSFRGEFLTCHYRSSLGNS